MKLFIFFSIIISCAHTAYSTTSIQWTRSSGGGVRTESPIITPVPLDSVWVLYYSTDMTIDPLDSLGNLELASGNDEVLLVANNNTSLGILQQTDLPGSSDQLEFGSSVGEFVGGFLYSRIFNFQNSSIDSSTSSTWDVTIPDGTYYHETGMFGPSQETSSPPSFLQVYWNDNGDGVIDGSDGLTPQMTQQFYAVPEPTTLAVIGMAMAVIYGMRRKIRR